jgi:hypothetical protein
LLICGDSFLEGTIALDVGVITDRSPSVSEELLIDTFERSVFLPPGLLDAVLVVLVVLILGGVILVLSHL